MSYPVDPLKQAIEAVFPQVRSLGVYNRRYISGTTIWSQHSWGNAWDIRPPVGDKYQTVKGSKSDPITRNTLDDVYAWLVRQKAAGKTFGGRKIGTILWRVSAHYDHIHVETAPKFTGTPPKTPTSGGDDDMAAVQVIDLQKALNKAGVTDYEGKTLVEDDVWGSRTESALVKGLTPALAQTIDATARKRIQAIEGRLSVAKVVI